MRDIALRSSKKEERPADLTYGAMATALVSLRYAEKLLMEKPGNHAAAVAAFREAAERINLHIPDYLGRHELVASTKPVQ